MIPDPNVVNTLYADDQGRVGLHQFTDRTVNPQPLPPALTRMADYVPAANPALAAVVDNGEWDRLAIAADGSVTLDGAPLAIAGAVTLTNAATMDSAAAAQLAALRTDLQTLASRLSASAPTTLAGAVGQLRELQAITARATLANVRLIRLVTRALDATD